MDDGTTASPIKPILAGDYYPDAKQPLLVHLQAEQQKLATNSNSSRACREPCFMQDVVGSRP
jgi:hypothetical protein